MVVNSDNVNPIKNINKLKSFHYQIKKRSLVTTFSEKGKLSLVDNLCKSVDCPYIG